MLIQVASNPTRRGSGTKRRRVALPVVLEDLEGRVLLSGAHHHHPVAHHPVEVRHPASHNAQAGGHHGQVDSGTHKAIQRSQTANPIQTVNVQPEINIQPMINVQPSVSGGTASTRAHRTPPQSNPTTGDPAGHRHRIAHLEQYHRHIRHQVVDLPE